MWRRRTEQASPTTERPAKDEIWPQTRREAEESGKCLLRQRNTGLVVLANAGGKIVKGKILAARKTKNGGQKKQGRL
jgi:precorrin-6x reductase